MATWLLQTPTTASAASAEVGQGAVPFERRGVLMPFQRDEKQDFANGEGVELIMSNVQQILGTRAQTDTAPGELPFDPELGSWLHLLRHQNVTPVLRHQAEVYVVGALGRWEPRVEVTRVSVERGARVITIRTRFDIVDRYSRGAVLASDLEVVTELDRFMEAA